MSPDAALSALDQLITSQSVMLATNQIIMFIIAGGFAGSLRDLAGTEVCRTVEPGAGGH